MIFAFCGEPLVSRYRLIKKVINLERGNKIYIPAQKMKETRKQLKEL